MKTSSTQNSRVINASPEKLYSALTDPAALEVWQAPGNMTGKVHRFNLEVNGGYEMSLFYPVSENKNHGKTTAKEDRFTVRFIELVPGEKIVQVVTFDSDDPAFSGEMTMQITFEKENAGTKVTFTFRDIPPGISPEDNEAGTISSLEKLAHYVE